MLDHVRGSNRDGEMRLLNQLLPTLTRDDIVVYDRAAGHYVACARLRPHERLVTWQKSRQKSSYLTTAEWAALPEEISAPAPSSS